MGNKKMNIIYQKKKEKEKYVYHKNVAVTYKKKRKRKKMNFFNTFFQKFHVKITRMLSTKIYIS
ncbi:unnamed protein product [Arabidopsis halleri]